MPVDVAKVKELFLAALELPAGERAAYLDAACAGDAAMRQRLEDMLQSHDHSGELLPRSLAEMLADSGSTQANDTAALPRRPEESATPGERAGAEADDLPFLAPPAEPGHLGRLGHYEVQEVIGKGGFGIVLKAFDEKLHRVVAIKVLSPAYATVGSARQRFIREARAAAAVKNEHVVAIYNVQDEGQPPYLVMELIDGVTLQEKLDKKGPLSVKEILRIGMQMAEGLAAAHKQGLVHRDVKPANILLENGVERIKLTDFGLARAVDDASVSQSGTVAGTPMYMSPEQAEGLAVDHRSDLFSLGTVLYAMCTGHPPFRASGTMAVLKRVIEETPRPIREVNSEIPDWLETIIAKLHAKKPDDRFQTAMQVAELLGQHLAHLQQPAQTSKPRPVERSAQPLPPRRGRRVAFVILLGAFVGLLAIPFFVGNWQDSGTKDYGTEKQATVILGRPFFFDQIGLDKVVIKSIEMVDGKIHKEGPQVAALKHEPALLKQKKTTNQVKLLPGTYKIEVVCRPGYRVTKLEIADERTGQKSLSAGGILYWRPIQLKAGEAITIQVALEKTDAEAGWVQLFNGKDLSGWVAPQPGRGDWQVDKFGHLMGKGEPRSYLFSQRDDYSDFHLRAELKVGGGSAGGICFRCGLNRLPFQLAPGYKASLSADPPPGSLLRTMPETERGEFIAIASKTNFTPSTWFTIDLVARGNRIAVKINGDTVVAFSDDKLTYQRGRIALETYAPGTVLTFKKIEIKELPPAEPGWVPLFNGKDYSGWKLSGAPWPIPLTGEIVAERAGYMQTERPAPGDYHLRLETKLSQGQIDVSFHVNDRAGWRLNLIESATKSGIVDATLFSNVTDKSLKTSDSARNLAKLGEWFRVEIVAQNKKAEVRINGKKILELQNEEFTPSPGPIGLAVLPLTLDARPPAASFRKIEIKELPPG